jgi:ferrochelatase
MVLVLLPALVADWIETLDEFGDRGIEEFIEAGGEELLLVPCLNDHPEWVKVLAGMCEKA